MKVIPNFPNYLATKDGQIYSTFRNNYMKLCNNNGYLYTILRKNKKRITIRVHRVIAQTFIPNPDNKPNVNHIDGNKLNNKVKNLEWCTQSENVIHAYKTNLINSYKRSVCKLDIYTLKVLDTFDSITDAAKNINKHIKTIDSVLSGRNRTAGGFCWRYKEDTNYIPKSTRYPEINQIDAITNKIIQTFPTIRATAKSINGYEPSISKACKNGNIYKGFKFAKVINEIVNIEKTVIVEEDYSEWKDIKNYPNYKISKDGRIYSKRAKKLRKNNTSGDYQYISFCVNKKQTAHRINRLVALTYIPNPDNKPVVNHIDGNKNNNNVENLEWCTHSENSQHAIDTGLR